MQRLAPLPLTAVAFALLTACTLAYDDEGAGGGGEADDLYGAMDLSGLGEEDSYYRNDDLSMEDDFHMDDFSPSHVLTFPVPGGQDECFFERVAASQIKLRGAFFVSTGGSMDISVVITRLGLQDGNDLELFSKPAANDGIFSVTAERAGEYSFCFDNRHSSAEKIVTFALHVGVRTPEHANQESVTPLEVSVRSMHHALEDIVAQQNFLLLRTKMHMEAQDSTEWRVAYYTVFESGFMFAVTLGQVLYVHRLINNRQWV